mmetsp:Transcript_44196/g.49903  ORF Transcript_44196/g.49903 Transcript_44196/m.49903 type:complete len:587 (-) Transcript_44196:109-1869(-)
MTITFGDVRDPIVGVADFLLTPVYVGKQIGMNTADKLLNVVTGTSNNEGEKMMMIKDGTNNVDEDGKEKCASSSSSNEQSVYDLAKPMLALSTISYYYTELRSVTRSKAFQFADTHNISTECIGGKPSDFIVLYNAIKFVETSLKNIKVVITNEDDGDGENENRYRDSLIQLEMLRKKLQLDEGDIKILTTYQKILSEPKSLTDVKSDISLYDDYIGSEFRFCFDGSEFNKEVISNLIDGYCECQEEEEKESSESSVPYFHHIDDDFTSPSFTLLDPKDIIKGFKSEASWLIEVNDKSKRITVVFRGSIAPNDWVTNVQCGMVPFKLPGYTDDRTKDDGQNYGRVHEGFYNYMFDKTKPGQSNESTKSKGEEIIGMIKSDFFSKEKYKNYDLFVTGHSLGGSLSTLFATRAAMLDDFPGKTIMNVSIASPFVGNQEFRDEFYKLEMSKKIMHLRLSNDGDIVPLIPATTQILGIVPSVLSFGHIEDYKHVGMNVRLYDKEAGLVSFVSPRIHVFYPKKECVSDVIRNTLHANIPLNGVTVGVIGKHLCPEYTKRLDVEETKEELEKISFHALYANKDITGWSYNSK